MQQKTNSRKSKKKMKKYLKKKVTLLLLKNFELKQTVLTYCRGFTQEEEEDMLFMNLLQEKIDAVS